MLRRILTAAVLIPIVVVLVLWGPPSLLAAVAAMVALLALRELLDLGERVGLKAFRAWTFLCAAGIFLAQYSAGLTVALPGSVTSRIPSVELIFLIYVFGTAAIIMISKRPAHESFPAVASGSAALLFVALPFSYLVRLNEMPGIGRQLVLFTLSLVWAGDILAYFVGRSFGRARLAPVLSPKKTWEGAIANVVASALVALVFARWIPATRYQLVVAAALANIAGQVGDLLESAFKRGASVKDSSALLPGHGGMFDRIDSLILAAPVMWIAAQFFVTR